jgi:hypothetical protein
MMQSGKRGSGTHGDQIPRMEPPIEILNEQLASARDAFHVAHPSPTPGYTEPGRGTAARENERLL